MSRPTIIVCTCGRVHRLGQWIRPPQSLSVAMAAGTYDKKYDKCTTCKGYSGSSNRLIPVKEK